MRTAVVAHALRTAGGLSVGRNMIDVVVFHERRPSGT